MTILFTFFSKGKWKPDRLIIYGKEDKMEIHVLYDQCDKQYVNLTDYKKHPVFESFRADITPEEKEQAHKDRMHSLPPAIAAIVREHEN